jgi:hypothetical protein
VKQPKIITAILAAWLALSPVIASAGVAMLSPPGKKFGLGPTGWVWGVFGCSGGIIFTALVANWQQNRQLTMNEAMTCGLLFWLTPPKGTPR